MALWDTAQRAPLAELTWLSRQNHSVELLPQVQHLLGLAQRGVADLAAVAVARGPGSYSGLRVGVSTAKALALARDLPLIGLSSLEVRAVAWAAVAGPICALLPAGGAEVGAALFEGGGDWRRLSDDALLSPAALAAQLPAGTLVTGEISPAVAAALAAGAAAGVILPPGARLPRAGAWAELAWSRLSAGEGGRGLARTLQPFYLRRPSITPGKRSPLKIEGQPAGDRPKG